MAQIFKSRPWTRNSLGMRHILAASCLAMAASALPAVAQEGDGGHYFGANTGASGCPSLTWSVKRVGPAASGALAGVAWYEDMSGISVGRGNITQDGKFTFTLTSVQGNGPTGTASGVSVGGNLQADLDGPGCSKLQVRMRPMSRTPPGSG